MPGYKSCWVFGVLLTFRTFAYLQSTIHHAHNIVELLVVQDDPVLLYMLAQLISQALASHLTLQGTESCGKDLQKEIHSHTCTLRTPWNLFISCLWTLACRSPVGTHQRLLTSHCDTSQMSKCGEHPWKGEWRTQIFSNTVLGEDFTFSVSRVLLSKMDAMQVLTTSSLRALLKTEPALPRIGTAQRRQEKVNSDKPVSLETSAILR